MTIFKATPAPNAVDELLVKMRKIVLSIVKWDKFRSDFEINDKTTLQRCEGPGTFAWYVYESGTHLIPLNNIVEVRNFQRDWLESLKKIEGKKLGMDDALYVLNVHTGELLSVDNFRMCNNLSERLLKTVC